MHLAAFSLIQPARHVLLSCMHDHEKVIVEHIRKCLQLKPTDSMVRFLTDMPREAHILLLLLSLCH